MMKSEAYIKTTDVMDEIPSRRSLAKMFGTDSVHLKADFWEEIPQTLIDTQYKYMKNDGVNVSP